MRQLWINLHLCIAAFFTPVLLIIVISGGLYLVGVKGTVVETEVSLPANATLDLDAGDLEGQVDKTPPRRRGRAQLRVHQTQWLHSDHATHVADELRCEGDRNGSPGNPRRPGPSEAAHRAPQGARAARVQTVATCYGGWPALRYPCRAMAGTLGRRPVATNRDRHRRGAIGDPRVGFPALTTARCGARRHRKVCCENNQRLGRTITRNPRMRLHGSRRTRRSAARWLFGLPGLWPGGDLALNMAFQNDVAVACPNRRTTTRCRAIHFHRAGWSASPTMTVCTQNYVKRVETAQRSSAAIL